MTFEKNVKEQDVIRPAFKITMKFVVIGMLWIILSDAFLFRIIDNFTFLKLPQLHILKGIFFMGVSGSVLFYFVLNLKGSLLKKDFENKALFHNNPQPMWLFSASTLKITDVNNSAVKAYGYSRDRFLKMTLPDLFPHENVTTIQEKTLRPQEGFHWIGTWQHVTQLGSTIYVEMNCGSISFSGRDRHVLIVNDITDKVKAQENLKTLNSLSEQRIWERTAPLQNANEELAFRVQQMERVNDELITVNDLLQKANVKLAQEVAEARKQSGRFNGIEQYCFTGHETMLDGYEGVPPEFNNHMLLLDNEANNLISERGTIVDAKRRMESIHEIKKLSLVASKTDNVVIISDSDLCIEWVNEAFSKVSEYSFEEALGKRLCTLFTNDAKQQIIYEQRYKKLTDGKSIIEELVSYSKSGKVHWVKASTNPICNEAGKIEKYITIQTDITRQKEYEENITAIARELSYLIANVNAVIIGVDRNGYVNEWNQVSEAITGYSKNDVFGRKLIERITAEMNEDKLRKLIDDVLRGRPVSNIELPVYRKDQKEIITLLNATPRRNLQGEITGALIVGQDITELTEYRTMLEVKVQERTRELNEALKKEKALADMKTRFISIASHEFRTPLSSINFAAGYIRKYKHRIKQQDLDKKLLNIEQQVKYMTLLLEDVITFGKNEAGSMQVKYSKVNIPLFFDKIAEEVSHACGNSHRIVSDLQFLYRDIFTDEKLLRNIFINLLCNAIKFSPDADHIFLQGRMLGKQLVVLVKDTGMGISSDDLNIIFTPFHRGKNASAIQGTGLGLSIVKKAIDLLHGDIEVSSEEEKGTLFTVKIPFKHE